MEMDEGDALFHVHNSLIMSKGLLYVNTMPKGKVEVVLTFLIPTDQCHMALYWVHHDVGHQGQQRMLALAQERFWRHMMVEDCGPLCEVTNGATSLPCALLGYIHHSNLST